MQAVETTALDTSELYICLKEDYEALKVSFPRLVAVDLDRPIDPQLIFYHDKVGPIVTIDPKDADRLAMAIDDFLRRFQATKATRLISTEQWAVNCLLNIGTFRERGKPFQNLGKLVHRPHLLVVGNGPSVYRDIEWLKANRHNYTILSCWHSAPKLLVNDITPDYVGHMDKAVPEWETIPALPGHIGLICTPPVTPRFLEPYPTNPIYVNCSNESMMNQAVATALKWPEGSMVLGTTVYLLCLAAYEMGAESITLLGVDLTDPVPETEAAYKLYAINLAHFAKVFSNLKLYNASKGREIEGFIPCP